MQFCMYCGKTLPSGTAVCPHCHRTQPGYAAAEFVAEGDDAQYEEAEFELEEAEYELEEPEAPSAASGPEPDHVIVSPKPPVQEPPKRTEPVKYTVEPQQQSAPQPKKASGLSIAAFVCSLTMILCGLGAILAIVDLAKGKNEPRKKGLSIAALVISGLVMLIAFIGNKFIKPDLLAPKEQTLNEIAAAASTNSPQKANATAKVTAKGTAKPTETPKLVTSTSKVTSIAYGSGLLAGLREDGTVTASGYKKSQRNIDCSDWVDVVAIDLPDNARYIMGLKRDGTVMVTGEFANAGRKELQTWTDIVCITAQDYLAYGVRTDGTVAVAYVEEDPASYITRAAETIRQWTNIEMVKDTGSSTKYGRKKDGSWVSTSTTSGLRLVMSRYTGCIDLFGRSYPPPAVLYPQGTMAIDPIYWDMEYDLPNWQGLQKVYCNNNIALGLKQDGTVVFAAGSERYEQKARDVLSWCEVVDLASDGSTYVGLKKDGSLLFAGNSFSFNSEEWNSVPEKTLQTARQTSQAAKPRLTPAPMTKTTYDTAELQKAANVLKQYAQSYDFLYSPKDFVWAFEREGCSEDAMLYAFASVDINWKEYAVRCAQRQDQLLQDRSRKELEKILRENLFSLDEIEYGLARSKADFKENAVRKATSYVTHLKDANKDPWTREEMIHQLEYHGFTHEEAVYAADKLGLK